MDASIAEHRDMVSQLGGRSRGTRSAISASGKRFLSRQYVSDFSTFVSTAGAKTAALYEGMDTTGGAAVPIVVDDQVVQLAPPDCAVRRLATVISTTTDIRYPLKAAAGRTALKPESGATVNILVNSSPTFGAFTLSAYVVGAEETISMELAQDAKGLLTFLEQDGGLDLETCEETLYLHGTGFQQPQGMLGNVGPGITEGPDPAGNLVTVAGTLDLLPTLRGVYHDNASWLMNRATGVTVRKAQLQGNPGDPVAWTRQGAQDYLHGYPVQYSAQMPDAAHGACPVLFGDFAFGYLIGQRGGPGLRVRMLDQGVDPNTGVAVAPQGEVQLLIYRRVDGRVRRAEAIQSYNVSA